MSLLSPVPSAVVVVGAFWSWLPSTPRLLLPRRGRGRGRQNINIIQSASSGRRHAVPCRPTRAKAGKSSGRPRPSKAGCARPRGKQPMSCSHSYDIVIDLMTTTGAATASTTTPTAVRPAAPPSLAAAAAASLAFPGRKPTGHTAAASAHTRKPYTGAVGYIRTTTYIGFGWGKTSAGERGMMPRIGEGGEGSRGGGRRDDHDYWPVATAENSSVRTSAADSASDAALPLIKRWAGRELRRRKGCWTRKGVVRTRM